MGRPGLTCRAGGLDTPRVGVRRGRVEREPRESPKNTKFLAMATRSGVAGWCFIGVRSSRTGSTRCCIGVRPPRTAAHRCCIGVRSSRTAAIWCCIGAGPVARPQLRMVMPGGPTGPVDSRPEGGAAAPLPPAPGGGHDPCPGCSPGNRAAFDSGAPEGRRSGDAVAPPGLWKVWPPSPRAAPGAKVSAPSGGGGAWPPGGGDWPLGAARWSVLARVPREPAVARA